MRFKASEWIDITKRCRVGHNGPDQGAHIFDPKSGCILWYLIKNKWVRCTMHMDGQCYRTHGDRIYIRKG